MKDDFSVDVVGYCGKRDSLVLFASVEGDGFRFVLSPNRECFCSADDALEFLKKKVSEFQQDLIVCGAKLLSSDYERDDDDFPRWVCSASEV